MAPVEGGQPLQLAALASGAQHFILLSHNTADSINALHHMNGKRGIQLFAQLSYFCVLRLNVTPPSPGPFT